MSSISDMPEALTWRSGGETLRAVGDDFTDLLASRLGQLLGRLCTETPESGRAVVALLRELPDAAFHRLLTSPEAGSYIHWPAAHGLEQTASFFTRAALAELAMLGHPHGASAGGLWTALGDACILGGGRVLRAPRLAAVLPIDFDSPCAMTLDFNGRAERTLVKREPIGAQDRERILERLTGAAKRIAATDAQVLDAVLRLTKVLILQKDPEAPTSFASGSSGQYIGRSVFSNPQLGKVDEVELAEGLVHEAIHALLYMQEQLECWVPAEYYGTQVRAVSPWTGNQLPLRPYLQACFVWYGLLHFWALALEAGSFDPGRVRDRIAQCASGFLDARFIVPLDRYRAAIAPRLRDAILAIRGTVHACADVHSDLRADPALPLALPSME